MRELGKVQQMSILFKQKPAGLKRNSGYNLLQFFLVAARSTFGYFQICGALDYANRNFIVNSTDLIKEVFPSLQFIS